MTGISMSFIKHFFRKAFKKLKCPKCFERKDVLVILDYPHTSNVAVFVGIVSSRGNSPWENCCVKNILFNYHERQKQGDSQNKNSIITGIALISAHMPAAWHLVLPIVRRQFPFYLICGLKKIQWHGLWYWALILMKYRKKKSKTIHHKKHQDRKKTTWFSILFLICIVKIASNSSKIK